MASTTGTQVTLTIPDGAPPGTLLSVPVRGGSEQIKVRVPEGLGPGSMLIMTQPEGSDEWGMKVGKVVPVADDGEAQAWSPNGQALDHNGGYQEVSSPGAGLDAAVAFTVRLDTTVGAIDIIVRPDWAPLGTRRFLELASSGDLTDLAFYRAIKGCIVQFGLPAKRTWPCIPDDPPTGVPFLLGAVSFAAIGENTRRSTLFICIGDMSHMLGQKTWETPIGAVAESSLDVLESLDTTYGDIAEFGGTGPDTSSINAEGNAYLRANFPRLSYIKSAWPLNWPPDGNSAPPSPAAAQQAVLSQPQPRAQAPPGTDPAGVAAFAAQEAQRQAAQASQAASDAARAQYAEEARQAALTAQAAAAAAQASAQEARDAAAALKAALAQAEQQAQAKKLVAVVGGSAADAAVMTASWQSAAAAPAIQPTVSFSTAASPGTIRAAAPAAPTAAESMPQRIIPPAAPQAYSMVQPGAAMPSPAMMPAGVLGPSPAAMHAAQAAAMHAASTVPAAMMQQAGMAPHHLAPPHPLHLPPLQATYGAPMPQPPPIGGQAMQHYPRPPLPVGMPYNPLGGMVPHGHPMPMLGGMVAPLRH